MSIIKHVTLQKIVAHDFRYDPRNLHAASLNTNRLGWDSPSINKNTQRQRVKNKTVEENMFWCTKEAHN